MNSNRLLLLTACMVLFFSSALFADNSGRLYGKITTVDGDVFTGYIRWDKNEACWVDKLDGTKDLESSRNASNRSDSNRSKYSRKNKNIKIFGITIGDGDFSSWTNSAQSGVRFGHIKTLENSGDNEAMITFKSGERIEFSGGSSDIGDDIRELIIEDPSEGEIEFVWDDIEIVEFMSAPKDGKSAFGDRLYGTLTTRRGDEFNGFVCWDVDELFPTDILDGEDKGRKRKINFDKIASIARYSSNGATVTLTSGDEIVLRGSNDVDDSNRGIIISEPEFGQVRVNWDEFEKLVFKPAPKQIQYEEFDGGKPLRGTVYTESGERYTGKIRWDDDEEYTWETLNGDNDDIEYEIEFGKIKEISKKSYRSSMVTIKDGRTFRLRGSNDVDEDNKGIIVMTDDGEEIEVDWEDFERLEFES